MSDATRFHARPDRRGYDEYTIDIASPELPSGAAWLANCLIELGVPAWKPWGCDDAAHWCALEDGRWRYVGGDNGWSRVLPALRGGRTFRFRTGSCVRVHHTWPDVLPRARRHLLFVRDPCDALYSAWRRVEPEGDPAQSFRAFCMAPYGHFPLSRVDYLRVFLRCWRSEAQRHPLHIVRFEDYRRDAVATLGSVAGWLELGVDARTVAEAAAASTVDRVRDEDCRLHGLGIVERLIVRGAAPGECARDVDTATASWLAHAFADERAWLGRAPPIAPRVPPDADDALHARLLHAFARAGIPVDPSGWLSATLRAALAGIEPVEASLTAGR